MKKERKNILLVEDDRGHAELIHRAFENYRESFSLTVVTRLQEARAYLGKSIPHLVIADLVLPDGRGTELLPPKEMEELPAFPLVIMTGYGDEQVAVDSLKAGALDYVVKLDSTLRDIPRIAERAIRQWEAIVDRKRMEVALADSEEKFRALIENAGELIIIMDMIREGEDWGYRYLSPAVVDITGFSCEDVIVKTLSEFLHPDDKAMVYDILSQATENAGITLPISNFRVRHKDGRWVILEGLVTNMMEIAGVKGIVLNCRDVTRLKQMEEVLIRVQKLESVGLLAGGIAHDFNNILTVILGNLDVAKNTENREMLLHNIDEAEKWISRARDLTQQLLTFAKGGEPVKETVSIEEVIKDIVAFSLRGSDISLQLDFQDGLCPVDIDRGQISQVIHNLVINAKEAMPDGGVITVRVLNTEINKEDIYGLTPGKYIKIEVQDQGNGIPPLNREKIFDPYFTTKSKGSGLGLSIVHSVIAKHNGAVDFHSHPDEGTLFFIYLPVSEKQKTGPRDEDEIIGGYGKILVVDDEASIRDVATLLLESLGYNVITTESGEQAVEICKKELPDVVILDLTIPDGIGGKETAEEIRKFNKDIKLIVSSGYSNDPVMSRYQECGFDDVLMKPYKLEQIAKVVHRLLGKK
ncbi:MAG: two-component system, cell cycle sensor histidine kinase and response regulator CckA [Acidobacteriota bacterium]|nr:two-component system, cell cycle sensor histidine kinase and response regulator CckA [Acidobacteriota bacterium]